MVEASFRLLGANAVLHGYHTQRDGKDGLQAHAFKSTLPPSGAGDDLIRQWPRGWPEPVLGKELYDRYVQSAGGLESYFQPDDLRAQHGHVSVRRSAVLLPPLSKQWIDVPTGGQKFGEDIRFVKSVISSLGRADSTLVLVGANLTLYQPSWGASKRCGE